MNFPASSHFFPANFYLFKAGIALAAECIERRRASDYYVASGTPSGLDSRRPRRCPVDLTRRNFLEEVLAAGSAASLLPMAGAATVRLDSPQPQQSPPANADIPEHQASDYWKQLYLPVDPTVPKNRGPITHVPPSERQVLFLHSGSNGLRYIEDIQEEELLDYPGDVQVSMVLGQFRPGNSDREFLKHVQSSQLRVDCVQSKPYRDILAPLAWCAMASLKTDQAGRLPSLDSLGFNSPNTMTGVTKILLPGGSGKLAVNLYVAKGHPVIEKILREALQLAPAVAPVMNFPAVSVPALRTFSEIIGALEERSAFIMNSQLTHAVTTRQALADPDRPINYFQLIPGEYVLVPKLHIEELKPHLGDLQLQQGYLVDKDPAPVDPVVTRKDKAVPGVTYATLRISVNPAPGGSNGSNQSGGGGEPAAGPAKHSGGAPPQGSKTPASEPKTN
jgi:hypothetical protein